VNPTGFVNTPDGKLWGGPKNPAAPRFARARTGSLLSFRNCGTLLIGKAGFRRAPGTFFDTEAKRQ
jgi:hypothetical protein